MVQAYRRGLLRKSLPHGERSRLREDILLESIESEMLADYGDRTLAVSGALLSGARFEQNKRTQLLKEIRTDMRYNELVRLSDFDRAAQHRYDNSSLAASTIYDLISQAGWVTGDPSNKTK